MANTKKHSELTGTDLHGSLVDIAGTGRVVVGPSGEVTIESHDLRITDTYKLIIDDETQAEPIVGSGDTSDPAISIRGLSNAFISTAADTNQCGLLMDGSSSFDAHNGIGSWGTADSKLTYDGTDVTIYVSTGDFDYSGTGSKNFRITHPDPARSGKDLVHSCLEGPERGVYYRGTTELSSGSKTVQLPDYFEHLVDESSATVTLTCVSGWSQLWTDSISSSGTFTVQTDGGGDQTQKFHWVVMGVRKDIGALTVEPDTKPTPSGA